jgi:parafibromin
MPLRNPWPLPLQPAIPVRPSGRYERQTQQDATLKQMGAAELGVQVGFKPTAAAAAAPSAREQQGAAPPPPPPAVASTSRHGQQQQQQRSSSRSQQQQKQQQQQARHSGQGGPAKPPPRHGTPVIMVPPGMTALLNMHNIRSFLEGGEFQTTEQAKVCGLLSVLGRGLSRVGGNARSR